MGYIVWSIRDLSNAIKRMQENKFDCIIVFDGARGLGKSTGAVKLSKRFKNFRMRRDIVFSQADVIQHLAHKKQSIILADEMINVTYNRDFFNEEQKKILKMLNMYRDSCNVFIACVPNFADLDSQFRALVKIRVSVIKRGFAIVHAQNQSRFSKDPWDIKLNESIEKSWLKNRNRKPQYSKLTTFKGILKYGDLGKKQRILYEKIKQDKRGVVVQVDNIEETARNKYAGLYEQVKRGVVNQEMFNLVCLSNGWNIESVGDTINRRLRGENHPLRFKQLLANAQSLSVIKTLDKSLFNIPKGS